MKKRILSFILAAALMTTLIFASLNTVNANSEYIEQKYSAAPIYTQTNRTIRIDWTQAYEENPGIEKYRSQTQYIKVIDNFGEVGRYTTTDTYFDLPALPASDSSYIAFVGGSYENQNSFAIFKIYVEEQATEENNNQPIQTTEQNITVIVNGNPVQFDVQPQIINGRTMIPLRAVAEAFGAEVTWYQDSQQIRIRGKYPKSDYLHYWMNLWIGSDMLSYVQFRDSDYTERTSDGANVFLDSPPIIVDDRTLVPIRAIAEAIWLNVEWDEATRTVYIYE